MMKRQNKKRGFTIVELTIVVSVIAILSAVLIPTFSGVIKKSKQTADQQTVRLMNEAIAMEGEEDLTYNEIAEILSEAKFNVMDKDSWNPSYKGYAAYWWSAKNSIVLVDTEANKVVYPESLANEALDNTVVAVKGSSYFKKSTATTTEAAVKDIKSAITNGTSISLSTAVDLTETKAIQVPEDAEITVDLAGSTLASDERNAGIDHQYAFQVSGDLTITNATIYARGVEVYDGGTLTLGEDVVVNAVDANGGSAVYVWEGGKAVINGGKFAATNEECDWVNYKGAAALISDGDLTVNGGTFDSVTPAYAIQIIGGTATISNVTVVGARGGIAVIGEDTEVTLKNCTVYNKWANSAYALYVAGGATVTVDGGNFYSACSSAKCIDKNEGTITEVNNPVWTTNWVETPADAE